METAVEYAELYCLTNFSFLRSASHPEEMVMQAHALGYEALAITDECSLSGVVRAHAAAADCGLKLVLGSEFVLQEGLRIVLLVRHQLDYRALSALITRARRKASKGHYHLALEDLQRGRVPGLLLCLPQWHDPSQEALVSDLSAMYAGRCYLGVILHRTGQDHACLSALSGMGQRLGIPLVAAGGVRMHVAARKALLDTLTAIRACSPVASLGKALLPNHECHLRSREQLRRIYPHGLLQASVKLARQCTFSLDSLRYEYPDEVVPPGYSAMDYLQMLVWQGAARRWPAGVSTRVKKIITHELSLIGEMDYAPYFLTVHDIVEFARQQHILCQGRGSAANSVVCFCLGITEVDPERMSVLFERFISRERNEPPDIDVDFEHERREEVIQYIYRKYGRERAALAATVITYRVRSAVRDVGKALGLSADQVERMVRCLKGADSRSAIATRLHEAGFDAKVQAVSRLLVLVDQLLGFPRHLSQHVGGFVISRGPLSDLVPVENASMPDRTVIQWDKDDLQALGLMKVDCLALGMLSAIRKTLAMINAFRGTRLQLGDIPPEDPAVYRMIQAADTVGVFQIESRAQMNMLPRLKPACFYDLVIEVAIVRPGPIQGDMVHPYLRRRQGLEPVSYPSPEVEEVLGRTLGVPIFQEQVIRVATVAAGFSAGEADQVRRSMAAWRRRGGLEPFEQRLIAGMTARGYSDDFARQIYEQILGFGDYGFPESHSASFALLIYVSAWLKCHEPAAFFAAILNSLPMGFYAPAQLVQAARRQQVSVQPADVNASEWDCSLETGADSEPVLRLGLRLVKGLSRRAGKRVVEARQQGCFQSLHDLQRRAGLQQKDRQALSAADALMSVAGHRHQASWAVMVPDVVADLDLPAVQLPVELPTPTEGQSIVADYSSLGLSLRAHPVSLLRQQLSCYGYLTAAEVSRLDDGTRIRVAGLVIMRQRPSAANSVTFVTLEDETGCINLIVWRHLGEAQRPVLLGARLMGVYGRLQREDRVIHVVAEQLRDHSTLLGTLAVQSRDFH